MIKNAPQIMPLSFTLHEHLVDVPPPLHKSALPVHPLAADIRCKERPDTIPPQPHGLVTNVNAPLEQQILDIPQAERKADLDH